MSKTSDKIDSKVYLKQPFSFLCPLGGKKNVGEKERTKIRSGPGRIQSQKNHVSKSPWGLDPQNLRFCLVSDTFSLMKF